MKVVIIPATYNEKGNIEQLITILEEEVFPRIKNHKMYILVADDNSPDGTAEEVRTLMKKWKNLDINSGEKKGLGAAYIRAMTYAVEKMDADIVCEIDADLSHDSREIPKFLEKIDEGYDIVIGTRYSNGGSMPDNWPIQRKAFSVVANLLLRTITGRFFIHDWTGGYRAIKKEIFLKERNNVQAFQGYTFQVAFLYKSIIDGYKVAEVPIHFADRKLGRSKIAPLEYIINLLKYVIMERLIELVYSPFLKYAITGFIGYLINAITLEVFKNTLHVPSSVAASMGAELSIIWNFLMNNFWSFSSQRITSPVKLFMKFLQFNLVSLGSLILIGIVVGTITHFFGDTTLVRQIALVIGIGFFVIPYSYTMYNIFIWKRWHVGFLSGLQKIVG